MSRTGQFTRIGLYMWSTGGNRSNETRGENLQDRSTGAFGSAGIGKIDDQHSNIFGVLDDIDIGWKLE